MLPRPARLAVVIGGLVVLAVALASALGGKRLTPVPVKPAVIPTPPGSHEAPLADPFSYDPARRRDFEARAAAGNAHILYALSPGGAFATAQRTARWRPLVDAAARQAGVSPDLLEALVFLESAGRADALTGAGVPGAAGLTQIVAETAVDLLGMHVDIARSARLSRRIARAADQDEQARFDRLSAQRRRVDDRFVPRLALAATARYLRMALKRFGTPELALESYHMGMGNLEQVLRLYAGGPTSQPLPYAQVYFDSSPLRHQAAYAKLASLGDDSANYLWKLLAARDIMRLYRTDPRGLQAEEALQTAKASAEEVLHPSGTVQAFQTPAQLAAAFKDGQIVALPDDPARTGLRIDPRMGELARRLGQSRSLYRGLRPEALGMALYIGAKVRAMARDPTATLTLSSTVRDAAYQRQLITVNPQATRNYSLHTTGWAFDVLRRYRSKAQALAFQFVLDRLTSLDLIAWVREPAAIHVTASADGAALEPLVRRLTG